MKKILFAVLAAFSLQVATAQDRKVDFNELPADAINFVRQHFLVGNVASVWKDVDYKDEEYSVIFKDGVEVEFNGEGNWKEIKVHRGKLPNEVVPAGILDYVQKNFSANPNIKKLGREIGRASCRERV